MAAGDVARFGALAAALAILVGLVLALFGLLHMGFVSRFISAGVQAGFMFGLGLTIIVGQVPKLLGVSQGGGDFFPQLGHLLASLDDVNGWTAALGLGSLAVLLAAKRVAPAVPAALAVVVAGIAVVGLFGLAGHGVEVIGRIEGAVPGLVVPAVGWRDLVALLPGALAIAVIGYAESATVAESLADEHGYTVRPDRELLAIGGANVLAATASSWPCCRWLGCSSSASWAACCWPWSSRSCCSWTARADRAAPSGPSPGCWSSGWTGQCCSSTPSWSGTGSGSCWRRRRSRCGSSCSTCGSPTTWTWRA